MIQETPQADQFKQQMGESLRQETLNSRAVTIKKNDNVYTCGDNDELVYFIESGQINCLCSRLKEENACWPSIQPEIFLASCVCLV